MRASISAWLMGGHCIWVSLLCGADYRQGERSPYCIFLMALDRSAQARQLAQERVRRTAGELTEVLDEVRLIDVSAIGRQVGPRNRMHRLIIGPRDLDIRFAHTLVRSRAAQLVERAQHAIEAQQPRHGLGGESHPRLESRNQSTVAATGIGGE